MNKQNEDPIKVTLYWNHICILHNFEKNYLSKIKAELLEEDIDLDITYFGLGYDEHMAEYLTKEEAKLPDLIVSADLEVFECPNVFGKLGNLHKCKNWHSLKDTKIVNASIRNEELLPLVVIPLTLYGQEPIAPVSLLELASSRRLSFGGINNSAGKITIKAIWERCGVEAAEDVLNKCTIYDLPIQAFNAARKGQVDYSLVPSIYSLRADGVNSFSGTSTEGPALLPSYFCARESVDEDVAKIILEKIFTHELMEFYASSGDLIICLDDLARQTSSQEYASDFMTISQSFIDDLDVAEFYRLYKKYLPSAEVIFSN